MIVSAPAPPLIETLSPLFSTESLPLPPSISTLLPLFVTLSLPAPPSIVTLSPVLVIMSLPSPALIETSLPVLVIVSLPARASIIALSLSFSRVSAPLVPCTSGFWKMLIVLSSTTKSTVAPSLMVIALSVPLPM